MRMFHYIAVTALAASLSYPGLEDPAGAADPSPDVYSLDRVLELAVERSPLMANAKGAVRQSQGQEMAAAAYPNPNVTGIAGRGAIRDPSTGATATERTFTIEQPIEWLGKRAARKDAAAAGMGGATAALDDTRLALIAEVKIAFYSLLLAQRDLELATHTVARVTEVQRTVKARVAAGEATSFDTLKATVEVQKAQKELSRSQNTIVAARTKLNTLTDGGLGKRFEIQGDFLHPVGNLDAEPLVAQAIERHPALRRLDKLAEQAEHAVRLERASRIPTMSVIGSYHREAGDESLVAGLSLPLPLWYRRQGEIETALGTQYRAEADRRRTRNELEQAITQAVQDARTAQEQLQVFETGLLKQAEQTLAVARTSFREGAASLLDVLDAQRVYRQTLLEYAQVQADLSIALVRLERSLGGPL